MRRKKAFTILLVLAVLASLYACATTPMGPKEVYYLSSKEFTQTLQKYNSHYRIASQETKAEWKREIDPVFKEADVALSLWHAALFNTGTPSDPVAAEERYLKIKTTLLKLLVEKGVI